MRVLREVLLGLGLIAAGSLVTWGIAGWSADLARVVAGLLLAGLCVLFLAEVG